MLKLKPKILYNNLMTGIIGMQAILMILFFNGMRFIREEKFMLLFITLNSNLMRKSF